MRSFCFGRALSAQGLRGKVHILKNIERAGLVLLVKIVVAPVELNRVVPAQRGGKGIPLVVGIHRNQGVIQVEQG